MLRFFRSYQPLALFILPVIAVLLWLPALMHPVPVSVEHTMPLYRILVGRLSDLPLLSAIIGLVLATGGAFLLNYITSAHEVLARASYLPALFYLVLVSCAKPLLTLHPLLFSNVLIMLAVHNLFSSYRRDTAFGPAFDAGFLISLATLFYLPSIVMFPVIWVGLAVLRPFVWREWIISLLGLAVPFLFVAVYYFWFDRLEQLWQDTVLFPVMNRFSQFQASPSFMVLLGVLVWLFLLSAAQLVTGIRVSKLKAKNTLLVMVWVSVFSASSMLLAPSVSVMYYIFLAIPLAVFFANYFLFVKRAWWGESMLWILAGAIVFHHIAG
jgi:hypothetical protein